jgi:hypothetical protein
MVRFFDSFGYASAAAHTPNTAGDDLRANWIGGTVTVTELANVAEGRRCYLTGAAGADIQPIMLGLAGGEILFGFRFFLNDLGVSRVLCELWEEGPGFLFGTIGVDGTDNSLVYTTASSGDPTASIVSKATAPLAVGWQYVEVRVKVHATLGEVHWQIDGTDAGSDTGIDTLLSGNATSAVRLVFLSANSIGNWDADDRLADIYVADFADPFLGTMEVWYQPADTAGASADFTPSAGANHENVDDEGSDGDATYNESATPGDRDSFAHSSVVGAEPAAVQVLAAVRSVGTPYARVVIGLNSDGSESEYGPEELVDVYDVIRGPLLETDPDTAAEWTAAGLNAAETFIEVQA